MKSNLYWVETEAPGRLAIMARPRAGDWLVDEMRALRAAGVDLVVSLLTDDEVRELELEGEAEACTVAALRFQSFPIPDRSVPALNAQTLSFVSGLRVELSSGRSMAIHCRMGIGRSSLIAAAVLGMDPEEALRRLSSSRGLAVPDTAEQRQWIIEFPR